MPYIQPSSFKGNRLTRGKHIDTIVPALFRNVKVNYQRERLELPDGDFVDLDWITHNHKKVLILFHGLEGSSHSQYIKGMASYFSNRGWDICAMNFRSCSGQMNRLAKSYHSGATEDIAFVIQHLVSFSRYDTLIAGGFSLGGNVLLKYLGEQKFEYPASLKAAFAFSVPVDLAASAIEMAKFQNTLYMKRFLKTLQYKMTYKASQFPENINLSGIHKMKTFIEFDDQFTAPINGFKDASDYYAQCNALPFLPHISIPTLLVNAQNDPFLTQSCFPKKLALEHPYVYLETPSYGGHVGFSENLPNKTYWSEARAYAFISTFCN